MAEVIIQTYKASTKPCRCKHPFERHKGGFRWGAGSEPFGTHYVTWKRKVIRL